MYKYLKKKISWYINEYITSIYEHWVLLSLLSIEQLLEQIDQTDARQ